jgi:predicted N-acetyltransferase YhbS
MEVNIRSEERRDYKAVEKITREAFYNENDFSEKGFGCSEHFMVNQLRRKDGIMSLDFIAEVNNEIVGHVIYSEAYVETLETKEKIDVITFGPLSVKPKYQNLGIGSKLMVYSLAEAKKQGYGAIIIYGHPNYYPRFGFVNAEKYNITTNEGKNFDAFMAMELIPGYFDNIKGRLILSEIFEEMNYKDQIIEFDKQFQ